jgi:hypothetical protein
MSRITTKVVAPRVPALRRQPTASERANSSSLDTVPPVPVEVAGQVSSQGAD